jgi:hypothetical protein
LYEVSGDDEADLARRDVAALADRGLVEPIFTMAGGSLGIQAMITPGSP